MPRGTVSPTAVTVTAAVRASAGRYCGFSLRDTGGAGAVVRIYDNASAASGTIVETISLVAGESRAEYYADEDGKGGVWCANGLYFSVVSGTVEGSVRVAS